MSVLEVFLFLLKSARNVTIFGVIFCSLAVLPSERTHETCSRRHVTSSGLWYFDARFVLGCIPLTP
jgi:hypothetical protein